MGDPIPKGGMPPQSNQQKSHGGSTLARDLQTMAEDIDGSIRVE
jgi:hypothetical protein